MSSENNLSNVIILTRGTKGDLYPLIHIGRGLKERGHEVTLLSNYSYKEYAKQEGFDFDFVALDEEESFQALIEMREFYSRLPSLLQLYKDHIIPNLDKELKVIEAKVRKGKTVILAHSNYYLSALFAMEKLNVPLHLCVLSPSFIYSFPLFEGIANRLSEELNAVRSRIGLAPVHDWKKWLNSYNQCFALWPEWFSDEGQQILPKLEYVGFLSVNGLDPKPLQENIKAIVADDTTCILITHGTSKPFNDNYFEIAIKVCETLNCKLIVSTPFRELLPKSLSDNIIWVDYCPFDELLPSIDLIIHHGGIGTTREAAANSVPQLIIGQGFDRQDNGRIVKNLGLGDCILPKALSEELLFNTVSRLLHDNEIKSVCNRYAPLLKNQKPQDGFYEKIVRIEPVQSIHDSFVEASNTDTQKSSLTTTSEKKTTKDKASMESLSLSKQALLLQMLKNKSNSNSDKKLPPKVSAPQKRSGTPLSVAQNRIWRMVQIDPENPAYRVIKGYQLNGPLNIELLERSFSYVIQQQEMLRTSFIEEGDSVKQILNENFSFSLRLYDLQDIQENEQRNFLRTIVTEDNQTRFDLATAPLIRVKLVTLSDCNHVLILTGHLIISDAHSLDLILGSVGATYNKLCKGEAIQSGEIDNILSLQEQHADYVYQQEQLFTQGIIEKQKDYWQQHLADMNNSLGFPADKERTEHTVHNGDYITFSLGKKLTTLIKNSAQSESASAFMFLMTAFNILCSRFTGKSDIVLGNPISNRKKKDWQSLVGHFANMLILRNTFSDDMSVKDVLAIVRKNTLDAFANQDIPFEILADLARKKGISNRNTIIQNTFGFQNLTNGLENWDDITISVRHLDTGIAKYELEMFMWEQNEEFNAYLVYDTGLFQQSSIERIKDAFSYILEGMIDNIERPICTLPLCNEFPLITKNNTISSSTSAADYCLYQQLSAQATKQPDLTAIYFSEYRISYGELHEKVERLAHSLGRKSDVLLGVCTEHSLDSVIAVLALTKIGQSFIFINPDLLKEERNVIIQSSQLKQMLIQPWLIDFLELPQDINYLPFSYDDDIYPKQQISELENLSDNASIAYYYSATNPVSQSTVTQQQLDQSVKKILALGDFSEFGSAPLFTHLDKPEALTEIALSLATGSSIVIQEINQPKSLEYWREFFSHNIVTHLFLTFGEFESLQKFIVYDGLVVPSSLHNLFITDGSQAVHLIDKHYWSDKKLIQLKSLKQSPYAFYIDLNRPQKSGRWQSSDLVQFMIANEALRVCPFNVPGILYFKVATTWENTGLNARQISINEWEILGATFPRPKENIFPEKIANVLRSHVSVRYSLVQHNNEGLRAYVVLTPPCGEETIVALYHHLKMRLADDEMPISIQVIERLPFIADSMKINWEALPEPLDEAKKIVAPTSEQEVILLETWSDILNIPKSKICMHDNFFDIGGHSLLATQVISRIQQRFKVKIPLKNLFENPTIAALSFEITSLSPRKRNQLII